MDSETSHADHPFGVFPLVNHEQGRPLDEHVDGSVSSVIGTSRNEAWTGESDKPETIQDNTVYRPQFELVVVIDSSASMTGPLRFDPVEQGVTDSIENAGPSRMAVAKQLVWHIYQQLEAEDKLALITYTYEPQVLERLQEMRKIRTESIQDKLRTVSASTGTNVTRPLEIALEEFPDPTETPKGVERRILLVTDMKPVVHPERETILEKQIRNMSYLDIYFTFGGIGSGIVRDDVCSLTDISGLEVFDIF